MVSWDENKRYSDVIYIVCPDMDCDLFELDKRKRQYQTEFGKSSCPYKEKVYKILHCFEGHPNKVSMDKSSLARMDCDHERCYAVSFELMSEKYQRIPLEKVEDFLKKEFVGNSKNERQK